MTLITDFNNPWTGITKPGSGFSIKRVDPKHPHDFFWGKDSEGAFLLLLEIDKELSEFLENKVVILKGVKTDIRHNPITGEYFFMFCLQNMEDADIFYSLCFDLIERTKEVKAKKTALEAICVRLNRWKSFLSKKKNHLLTAQEIQGLYAELEFLYVRLTNTRNQLPIIEGWQGPLDGPHDFVLGDYAVEIKSVANAQKNSVRISSENQLATHLDKLFLHVLFLAEYHDCKKGNSLNTQVENIRNVIGDADNRDLFDSRLYAAGYMELRDYDTPCYTVVRQKTFDVMDGFPRITPAGLEKGLTNVSYDLNMNILERFSCDLPFERE